MKQIRNLAVCIAATMILCGCNQKKAEVAEVANTDNIYQFNIVNGTGDTVSLSDYQGKVLLVVNTATQCGFTPQYAELQALYATYHDRGLEILDFPCNQFGEQAPGTIEEIHAFCTGTYGTTFPQMTTDPRGAYLHAAFKAQDSLYDQNPDIKWNFTKFLIDREGNVVCRFEPTTPGAAIVEAVEKLM